MRAKRDGRQVEKLDREEIKYEKGEDGMSEEEWEDESEGKEVDLKKGEVEALAGCTLVRWRVDRARGGGRGWGVRRKEEWGREKEKRCGKVEDIEERAKGKREKKRERER